MAAVGLLRVIEDLDPPGRVILRKIIEATGQTELDAIPFIHPIFNRLVNLESLTLNNGHIQKIENLSNLRRLRHLNLANNRIYSIENLHHHPDLETLVLDFNPIQVLEWSSFEHNPRLHTLSIRVSAIGNLQRTASTLQRMTSLRRVSLQVQQAARHSPVGVSDARAVETPSPALRSAPAPRHSGVRALAAAIASALGAGGQPASRPGAQPPIGAAAAAAAAGGGAGGTGAGASPAPLAVSGPLSGSPSVAAAAAAAAAAAGSDLRRRAVLSAMASAVGTPGGLRGSGAGGSSSGASPSPASTPGRRRSRSADLPAAAAAAAASDGAGASSGASRSRGRAEEDEHGEDEDDAGGSGSGRPPPRRMRPDTFSSLGVSSADGFRSLSDSGSDEDFEDAEDDEFDDAMDEADGWQDPQPMEADGDDGPSFSDDSDDEEDDEEDESDSDAGDDDDDEDELVAADQEAVRMSRSPVCLEPHYRAFIIHSCPHLIKLDGLTITAEERLRAPERVAMYTEQYAYGFSHKPAVFRVLREREFGARSVTLRSHSPSVMRDSPPLSQRALVSARLASVRRPRMEALSLGADHCMARQFEYSPSIPDTMVVGTTTGEVVVMNPFSGKRVAATKSSGNVVLGICWLRTAPMRFVAGCENGCIELFDVDHMRDGKRAMAKFDEFKHLTCVHANCTDQYLLASGYHPSAKLFDMGTGKIIETLENIHGQHINVLKFANHNPNLFCTSSFDRSVKLWDLRTRRTPIFERQSSVGCVMTCFSPDDRFILSSAIDNEVRQYTLDGTPVLRYELKQLRSNTNYTRAYYMNGSEYIIVGSCEESSVKVCETVTGRILLEVECAGDKFGPSPALSAPYIQSLRSDPFADFHCSVVLGYNASYYQARLVRISLLQEDPTTAPLQVAG